MGLTSSKSDRTFKPSKAKGGCELDTSNTPSPRRTFRAGFNTITLTDCCATTSAEGHRGATEGTFGMFSSPMTGEEFLKKINA